MSPSTVNAIKDNSNKKGDVLAIARIAGIQGQKIDFRWVGEGFLIHFGLAGVRFFIDL